jgi:hypothetical protein
MGTTQGNIAVLEQERLDGEARLDEGRLIGGTADSPLAATEGGDGPAGPASSGSAAPAESNGDVGLILGTIAIPGAVVTPTDPAEAGSSSSSITNTGHAVGPEQERTPVGAPSTGAGPQIPVAAEGGLGTVTGTPDPAAAGGTGVQVDNMQIISQPVSSSLLAGSTISAAGATDTGAPASAVGSQLFQLVTAMAGFGGEHASPIGSSIAQHEVDAARVTLAASLHFSQ